MKRIEKTIAGNLKPNERIKVNEVIYFLVDYNLEMGQVLFQSLNNDKLILNTDEDVDMIADADRGFDPVAVPHRKNGDAYVLPMRKTAKSAGYDFYAPYSVTIEPGEFVNIYTNVKAFMMDDEELRLSIRSGLASKGLILMNGIGVVDSDYYSNPENDGNIGFCIMNTNPVVYNIAAGDRIGQGVFSKYLLATGDMSTGERTGGFGSTGR